MTQPRKFPTAQEGIEHGSDAPEVDAFTTRPPMLPRWTPLPLGQRGGASVRPSVTPQLTDKLPAQVLPPSGSFHSSGESTGSCWVCTAKHETTDLQNRHSLVPPRYPTVSTTVSARQSPVRSVKPSRMPQPFTAAAQTLCTNAAFILHCPQQ